MYISMCLCWFDKLSVIQPAQRHCILSSLNPLGVVFDDETEEHEVDAIILATGYKIGFPCLDEGLVPVEKNQVPLYKYVFPYEHEHHTLAILGCLQPLGAIMPLSELQARWACKVFSGTRSLPSNDDMKKEMEEKRKRMARQYYQSERHTIQVIISSVMHCRLPR